MMQAASWFTLSGQWTPLKETVKSVCSETKLMLIGTRERRRSLYRLPSVHYRGVRGRYERRMDREVAEAQRGTDLEHPTPTSSS